MPRRVGPLSVPTASEIAAAESRVAARDDSNMSVALPGEGARVPVRTRTRSVALSAGILCGILPLVGGLAGCAILWAVGHGARPVVNFFYSAWRTLGHTGQAVRLLGYATAGLWCNSFLYLPLGIFLFAVRDFFYKIDPRARSPVTLAIQWTEVVALAFGWVLVFVFVYDSLRYGVNPRKPLGRLARRLYFDAYRLVRCRRATGGGTVRVVMEQPRGTVRPQ